MFPSSNLLICKMGIILAHINDFKEKIYKASCNVHDV